MDFDSASLKIEDKFLEVNPKIERKRLSWRLDGRLEWRCEHGVGHTIFYPEGSSGSHGCDGCCRKVKIPKWTKEEMKLERKLSMREALSMM